MRFKTSRALRGPIKGTAYRAGLDYKKADLHLHSNYSYDVLNLPELSPRALYEDTVRRGMGFFTLTDHETMRGIQALEKELERDYDGQPPIPLITGIEIKVKDPAVGHTVHVNVLGLNQRQMIGLARRRRSLTRFLDFCRDEDLYHAYNHPFWFERGERATLATVTELITRFPVIELNAGRIPQLNRRTLRIAREMGKGVVATSDSHTGQIARAYTAAPGETPEEFLRNVRDGLSLAVPHHASFRGFMNEVRAAIDLVFLKQSAFRLKPTFLRQNPIARRIAEVALGSDLVMRPRALKPVMARAMRVMAYPPAYAHILLQRKMHWQLGEHEFWGF
jgi:predicted metal-dependent phosphoesterase TrpH